MINKFGTLMNTIGSLGVGWYAAIIVKAGEGIPASVTTVSENWWGLTAFAAILVLGLALRVKDIRAKHKSIRDEEQTNALMEQDLHDYENRLHDVQSLIEDAVANIVSDKLSEIVTKEVEKQLHNRNDRSEFEIPVSGAE